MSDFHAAFVAYPNPKTLIKITEYKANHTQAHTQRMRVTLVAEHLYRNEQEDDINKKRKVRANEQMNKIYSRSRKIVSNDMQKKKKRRDTRPIM